MDVQPQRLGLSRFAADLPAVDDFVTLGEGNTPVVELPVLARQLKIPRLLAKLESHNPTGSYKDRAAAMTLSLARQRGKAGWIATSSGNAGMAMAAYGARAGLPGFLCLVAEAPLEKRLPLMPYMTGIVAVKGIGQQATASSVTAMVEQVRVAADRHNLHFCITANTLDPDGMRGVDSIAYELAEQVPDATHVYVPTGGGGLLVCIARGLMQRGISIPLIACQPEGCDPIVQCLQGLVDKPEIAQCNSGISALQIPRPPDGQLAVDAVELSRGWGTAISDDAILTAQRLLAKTEGVFVEPASATSLATLIQDIDHGRMHARAVPVLILTGAGWKDLGRFSHDASQIALVDIGEVDVCVDQWARDRRIAS